MSVKICTIKTSNNERMECSQTPLETILSVKGDERQILLPLTMHAVRRGIIHTKQQRKPAGRCGKLVNFKERGSSDHFRAKLLVFSLHESGRSEKGLNIWILNISTKMLL